MGKFEFAIQVMVIGFTVVLVTLFLLYGILIFFSRIFSRSDRLSSKKRPLESNNLSEKNDLNQTAVIAAITAAVSSYLESQGGLVRTGKIIVKPRSAAVPVINNWQIIGRKILMQGAIDIDKTRRNLR